MACVFFWDNTGESVTVASLCLENPVDDDVYQFNKWLKNYIRENFALVKDYGGCFCKFVNDFLKNIFYLKIY